MGGHAADFVWNSILLVVLVGTGLYLTIRLGFIQIRKFGTGWRSMFGGFSLSGKKADKDGMSSFQAAATSIAAQVGTGNIVGCATAILLGGPGAVFWIWVAAFLGMATIYSEAVLAQHFKTRDGDGNVIGGPVYYIRAAFKGAFGKFLAGFFAVAIILALGVMGNMVQANAISNAFATAFHVPAVAVGVILAIISAFIFMGGVTRIASVTEKLVPVMAVCYLVGSLIIVFANITSLPGVFHDIFVGAFDPEAIVGGGVGIGMMQAVRYGVARGLFSNEAGLGSTPHAHAMAKVDKPPGSGPHRHRLRVHRYVRGADAHRHGYPHHRRQYRLYRRRQRGGFSGSDGLRHPVRHQFGQHVRGNLPVLLRLLHHHRLVFLRRAEREVPLRREGCKSLLGHRGYLRGHRFSDGAASGLEPVRLLQRRYGPAQPDRSAGPVRLVVRITKGKEDPASQLRK